ncbi:hypothetical protein N657DRAFT_683561 [Parathielavia appendiculata]|uniref:Only prolin and serin are matching in the corresponding protein n=1 Tax=Parathielavia appendiculata TaxID=2587402 RepID=A0AAN6TTN6_9PEZI|nr:hypothetical protein N657DRAFT_683561 [Parathielavia appendiculata]
MSSGLKPLLLPRLVEERRKLEQHESDGELTSLNHIYDSSSSDLTSPSPVASTFSRTNHSRFSGSSSSLELTFHPCTDSPASPTQSLHASRPSKAQLPDVEEEPPEREEEEEPATPPKHVDREFGLPNYCLCDVPCSHNGDPAQGTVMYSYMTSDLDYDLGFLSDGDFNANPRQKKRRHGSDAGFSTWSTRLGSRLPSLPRWRSSSTSRRHDLTFSPASDPSLPEPRPSFSFAASRRSSSISGRDPRDQDSVPATPALSFYGSSESVVLPPPLDDVPATLGMRVARDRANATTPLLPPLVIESVVSPTQTAPSLQTSPLQSPSMIPSPVPELPAVKTFPTPPLSGKPSASSLRRRGTISSTFGDAPSPIPCCFDHQDSWSDRLGHANFTIEPRPYVAETVDLATLQTFRADWNLARTNYAKHLVRTGEHYGSTSKTYALTQAKWAELELEWQRNEDDLVQRLGELWKGDPSVISQLRRRTAEEKLPPPPSIPQMLSDDGKFPELGDVEIVGPMVREAAMVREGGGQDDKRNSASVWLKNLAGKVGLRK